MNTSNDIKQLLTMRQVAERYGFEVPRNGFIKCPFHKGDHTASLKIYDGTGGWHCFGCGKGGSVVDFVMELFGLNFKQAVLRLSSDFGLGLFSQRPSAAMKSRALEERRAEQRRKKQEAANFRAMVAELWYWKEVAVVFTPVLINGEARFHPMYAEAIKKIPYLEYWIDDHLTGRR